MTSRHQAGQAATEYLVVTAALALALWLPLDGRPAGLLLAEAIRDAFHASSYLLSID